MGKNKLKKFAENQTFSNLFQPSFDEVWENDFFLKGKWNDQFFKNQNPIILELGCGKGEYTINLAKKFPNYNFIGVDIKGARLWKGAKEAHDNNMLNVAFIRSRIEIINSFFETDEVDEIWVTFPDPQPRPSKARKRLTSSRFLSYYQKILKNKGIIHLKTDSLGLHEYTKALVEQNNLEIITCTNNLYTNGLINPALSIQTYYESMFLEQGKPITYINFILEKGRIIVEPRFEQ